MNKQTVVIIGFMGSGKTSVARELAGRLNCRAIDLDDIITQRERRCPKEIIDQDGEEAFRMIETDVLRKVLMDASARIIAMGGGAWTIPENRKMIAEHKALIIWLDVPFELCWRRIETGGDARPLARTREMAQKLYAERLSIYAQADVRMPVNENESAGDIAAKVVERVRHEAND